MPNISNNWVHFAGPKATLEQLADTLRGDNGAFDFQKILPVPAALKSITSSKFDSKLPDQDALYRRVTIDGAEQKSNEFRIGTLLYEPLQNTEVHELLTKFGATDSYGWKIKNWCTKWNAYETRALGIEDRSGHSVLTYNFCTAWAPPLPVLEKIVDLFPGIEVFLYADMENASNPVILSIPEITKYPVDPRPKRKNEQRKQDERNNNPEISDADLYGTYLDIGLESTAKRPCRMYFGLHDVIGFASFACLLENWSSIGPNFCVETQRGTPLFLESWNRAPSVNELGKELARVGGDPHLFGYVSKSRGARRVSTYMFNRTGWRYLVEASECALNGEKTYVPFEVARLVHKLEEKCNLRRGDGVRFSFENGKLVWADLIFARGWEKAFGKSLGAQEAAHA